MGSAVMYCSIQFHTIFEGDDIRPPTNLLFACPCSLRAASFLAGDIAMFDADLISALRRLAIRLLQGEFVGCYQSQRPDDLPAIE
jgi:hypothetical protein